MSFLSGLAAFGGGFAGEALAVKKEQSSELLKQQQVQLREAQLALMMEKQLKSLSMAGNAQAIGAAAGRTEDAIGGGGIPPDPTSDPSSALPFAPSDASAAPAAGPPAGQTGAAGLPPFAAPQPPGGAPAGRGGPTGQPPQTQVAPAGQPPGAAGAGMPAPPPQAGQPAAQLQQMPQGQPQAPGSQPQVQPGPNGAPSFDQRFQGAGPGMQQGTTVQAKPIKTVPITGQSPAAQAPPPADPYDPRKIPKGLKNLATPEQQAQAGITQPQQQKGTQVAGEWSKGQEATPDNLMSAIRKTNPGIGDAAAAAVYKQMLPGVQRQQAYKATQENRAYIRDLRQRALQDKEAKEKEHQDTISGVGEGIISGNTPPDMRGIYKDRAAVEAYLQKHGVSLTQRQLQWQRAQQMVRSISGPQQTKFLTLSDTVVQTIDRVKELSKQVPGLTNYPDFNSWVKEYYERVKDQKTPAAKVANQYYEDITTLREELAQLVTGGYAPTESAWKQAHQMLSENWSAAQLEARLDEAQRTINIRRNVMLGMGGEVTSAPNPYLGGGGPQQSQPPQQQQQQQRAPPKPGEPRKFKDGKIRFFKSGDEDDPNNWTEEGT